MNSLKTNIIVTIGPSTVSEKNFKIMKAKKVDYVRINMSHSTIQDLKETIKLSKNSGLKYVLDTEGSQIRTRLFHNKSLSLSENDIVKIYNRDILSTTEKPNIETYNNSFVLTPFKAIESIFLGDLIHINTFGPIISVVDVSPITSEYIIGKVIHGGKILNNKSVFIDKAFITNDHLPVLSSKDNKAIQLGLNEDVSHIAVSYVRSGKDVDHVRDITQNKMKIISKVENRFAYFRKRKT